MVTIFIIKSMLGSIDLILKILVSVFAFVFIIVEAKSKNKKAIIVAGIILILTIGSLVIGYAEGERIREETALQGSINICGEEFDFSSRGLEDPRKNFENGKSDDYFFVVTGNSSHAFYTWNRDAFSIRPLESFGYNIPLTVNKEKDEPLLISTEIYSMYDKKIVAHIEDNKWELKDNHFRRNYDYCALEVIDEYNMLVLQIELAAPNVLLIRGIFKDDRGYVILSENGIRKIPKLTLSDSEKEDIKNTMNKIPLLFNYPLKEHFAERRI